MTPRLALVAALALVVTGCASEASAPVASMTHTRPRPVLRVGLTEWSISLSEQAVPAGRVVVRVTNVGGTEHGLTVDDRAGHWQTPSLAPGHRTTLVVHVAPGDTVALDSKEPGQIHPMHATLRSVRGLRGS